MLNDRNYMNTKKSKLDQLDPMKCIFGLIGINAFMFFIFAAPSGSSSSNFQNLALTTQSPGIVTIFTFFSAMFLHGSTSHLFFNMFGVYMFGRFVANRLGSKNFLQLYFISGIAGNLLWFVSNMNETAPLIGASGALFGILTAAALLEPNMRVMLLIPPIPLKLKTMVIVFGLLEVFFTLTGGQGNVANIAHLGGLLGGYFTIRYIFKFKVWDALEYIFGKRSNKQKKKKPFTAPNGWSVHNHEKRNDPVTVNGTSSDFKSSATPHDVSLHDMDKILDKISTDGMSSLTKNELTALRNARNKMKTD